MTKDTKVKNCAKKDTSSKKSKKREEMNRRRKANENSDDDCDSFIESDEEEEEMDTQEYRKFISKILTSPGNILVRREQKSWFKGFVSSS